VVVVGHDSKRGEAAAAQLGANARHACADLSSVSSIDAMLRALPPGPVQCVFANAAAQYTRADEDKPRTDDGAVDRVLMTNFVGPFVVVQRLLPRLQHRDLRAAGRAVFTVGPQLDYATAPPSNLSATLSRADRYAASKTAVYCAASEFARRFPEIRVVLFVPPPVHTGFHPSWMARDLFPGSLERVADAWAEVALGPPRRASPVVWRVAPAHGASPPAVEIDLVKRSGALCFANDVVVRQDAQSDLFASVFSFAPDAADAGDHDSDAVHVTHADSAGGDEGNSGSSGARKRASEGRGGYCVVA